MEMLISQDSLLSLKATIQRLETLTAQSFQREAPRPVINNGN